MEVEEALKAKSVLAELAESQAEAADTTAPSGTTAA
jgi:hypothetical protein